MTTTTKATKATNGKKAPDGTELVKLPKRRGRPPKQTRLPGTTDERDEQIITAAEQYETLRNERMEVLREEIKAHDALLGIMQAKELTEYRFDDLHIHVVATKTRAKVKRVDAKDLGDVDHDEVEMD